MRASLIRQDENVSYKFALYEAAITVRKRAWQGREIPLEVEAWPLIADHRRSPEQGAETAELLRAVQERIEQELSPHQREVLVAISMRITSIAAAPEAPSKKPTLAARRAEAGRQDRDLSVAWARP